MKYTLFGSAFDREIDKWSVLQIMKLCSIQYKKYCEMA